MVAVFGLFFAMASMVVMTDKRDLKDVHPYLRPYVVQYENDIGMLIKPGMKVQYASMGPRNSDTLGVCFGRGSRIVINWDLVKPWDRDLLEAVIYHEMGHCHLKRGHVTAPGPRMFSCPDSVMEAVMMPRRCWKPNKKKYIKELKRNSRYFRR